MSREKIVNAFSVITRRVDLTLMTFNQIITGTAVHL